MPQFDHRESHDVDIFLPDAQRFQLLAVERTYGRQTRHGKHVHQLHCLEIRPSDGSHRKTRPPRNQISSLVSRHQLKPGLVQFPPFGLHPGVAFAVSFRLTAYQIVRAEAAVIERKSAGRVGHDGLKIGGESSGARHGDCSHEHADS